MPSPWVHSKQLSRIANGHATSPHTFGMISTWISKVSLQLVLAISFLVLALFSVGCTGYRVGPTNGESAGARSVQFRPFTNEVPEPRLVDALGSALRRNLQRDATYALNTTGDGDIVVSGKLIRYDRDPIAFQSRDILTARDYRIILVAMVTATERRTGKVLFEREFTGRSAIRVGADQSSVERQTVPLLAEDLARNIVSQLTEGSW